VVLGSAERLLPELTLQARTLPGGTERERENVSAVDWTKRGTRERRRLDVLSTSFRPAYVVWELTLRCDHACTHCGSRASAARKDELSTEEALGVVDQLADLGAREVVLIGGEAYLHEGFLEVAAKLRAVGVQVVMTTGGRGIDEALARSMAGAGVQRVSVSLDGVGATHDSMRNLRGSFETGRRALGHLRAAGIQVSSNINVNRFNRGDLEALYAILLAEGVTSWQIQLTTPLGRAADRPRMILQPYDLLELLPRIARLKERGRKEGLLIAPGNNLGYFGPEEGLLRSLDEADADHFQGCQAGRFVLGIESHGAVKGCPSLQSAHYVGGNLRQHSLQEIWEEAPELALMRARTTADLWGYCATCPFAKTCLGGCSFTAHALLGRTGNNPYCHFRARKMREQGLRERLVQVAAAPGQPFDSGSFEIVVEPFDSQEPEPITAGASLLSLGRPTAVS